MADYFVHRERHRAMVQAEDAGQVADSLDVRMAILSRVKSGEITLEQAQQELKRIKRGAKKAGKVTRAQAYMGRAPKAYRLQDRFDPTRYVEYNPGMWDLILIPQPPTKDGKL